LSAETAGAPRYAISGTATLSVDAAAQQGGLRLRAGLAPVPIASSVPLVQSEARFALSATLSAASLVCYSDTIYRDDFDGDGF